MRKRSAVLLIAAALSMHAMAGPARAALTAAGPIAAPALNAPPPADNRPLFYQDSNGLALQNCLDNTPLGTLTPMCTLGLLEEQDYSPTKPIFYNGGLGLDAAGNIINGATGVQDNPGKLGGIVNYPGASFYYHVSPNPKANIPIGTGSIRLILATIEAASVSKTLVQTLPVGGPSIGIPRPVDGQQSTFQRYLVDIVNTPIAGTYTLTHPWGTISFPCPTAGVLCKFVQDTPLGTPMNFLANPDPVLGGATPNTIGPFMVAAGPGIPAAPLPLTTNAAGHAFIGLGNAGTTKGIVPGVCPNCIKDANGFSFFRVDGPLGITTGNITDFQISGQVFGMGVTPGVKDFGPVMVGTVPPLAPVTVTVSNPDTVNSLAIAAGGVVLSGPNLADFTVTADTCSGSTLVAAANPPNPASSCTFAVTFAPKALAPAPEVAVRTATIKINPVAAATSPPAGTVNLSGTAQFPVTATSDANGAITDATGAVLPANQNAGAAVTYKVAPKPMFQVKDIMVGGVAQDITAIKPANPTQPVNFVAPPLTGPQTISATFMPSGNLTGSGTLGVSDALKALKVAVGLITPTATEMLAMDVAPLGTDGRPAGDGTQDLKDVMLILRRVLGAMTW